MFSIVLCTYNGERCLRKVIDKILAQEEYEKYVDQFIIVDNHSNDSTKSIIDLYGNKVVYSYENNLGLSNARLNGVNLATSEWVIFIDDDNELEQDWVKNAAFYIQNNPQIDIFNGAVFPILEFKYTQIEYQNMLDCLGQLACSHKDREDIINNPFPGFLCGAGMTVRLKYLKELSKNGWLNLSGRTGKSLSSGEDSEIVDFIVVKKRGKSGYCPKMIMGHNLYRGRLQREYLLELSLSICESGFELQSRKPWYVLRRFKTLFIYAINPIKINNDLKTEVEIAVRKKTKELIFKRYLFLR